MTVKTDTSYGIIPIRRASDSWEVLLIHQYSRIGNNTYWVFPKGHPKVGESPQETATRELKEETGLVAETILSEPTFETQYTFLFEGVNIHKQVQYFIGVITNDTLQLNNDEVKEAGWYSLAAAGERLDYDATKKLFAQARACIETVEA